MKTDYSLVFGALLIGVFLLVFSITLLNFGSPEDKGPVKIYYVDNISPSHQKVIDNFNQLNLGKIRVVPIDIPFYKFSTNERKELLIRALRSKSERLDIFAADIIWVSRFAKWAENLDKYFTQEEKDLLTTNALQTGIVNNNLVASPFYLDVGVMIYRKDLLNKLNNSAKIKEKLDKSITWKELIKLSKYFKNKEHFYTFPADEYEGLICSFIELLLTQDNNFFDSNLNFSNLESEKSLQLLVDLVNKYKISPKEVINYREKDAYNDFIQNDGLFVRGWQSFQKDFKNLDKTSNKERFVSYTQLPHFEGCDVGTTVGGWSLMLSKSSNHKEEAIKFIKYATSVEAQKIMYTLGSYLPVINLLYKDSTFQSQNSNLVFAQKMLSTGKFRPKSEDYTKISNILSRNIRLAISGKISVKQALKNVDSEIKIERQNP